MKVGGMMISGIEGHDSYAIVIRLCHLEKIGKSQVLKWLAFSFQLLPTMTLAVEQLKILPPQN